MQIARYAMERPVNTSLLMLLCLLGGLWGLLTMGRLEDPAFTIKQAIVVTPYPGATAEEVEREVTEILESAIQQMPQLYEITSKSMPGVSEITLEIEDTYGGSEMPQVWDELRRRVGDAQRQLPDGARPSEVNDDFGDVFGLFYAVTAPGFSDAEQREIARFLRRELLTVQGVAKVELAGLTEEAIYVEVPSTRLNRLGLPPDQVLGAFVTEGAMPEAGTIRLGDREVRVGPRPGFDTVAAIERLRIGTPGGTDQVSVIDIAAVSRGEIEPPDHLIRHNGERAFTVAVAGIASQNIVEIGRAVETHLDSIAPRIPLGVEISPIYEQHVVVDRAINSFVLSLLASIAIVITALCLFMGLRIGIVVGITLALTILGTFFLMRVFGIEMERISLGALIIAMGMLVDNAIVVAEGMLVGMQRGKDAKTAASEAADRTQLPLLGATVIGIMAFSGIGLSPDTTGEFLFSLFAVIGMSLLLSWVLAVTVTPLLGVWFFKSAIGDGTMDPYAGRLYRGYGQVVRLGLRARWLVVLGLVAVTASSIMAFGLVKQQFFPNSTTPLLYVHYTLPQGADLRATARDLEAIEARVLAEPEVEAVTTLVGRGASRFMLTYQPEQPNPAYGQLIIRTAGLDGLDDLAATLRTDLADDYPDAEIRTERVVFGPPTGASVEARLEGDDPDVLRALGAEAMVVMQTSGVLRDLRVDWRQRELTVVPVIDEERARLAGVGRDDIAQTIQFATSGIRAGTFREGDTQIPIIVRAPAFERLGTATLRDRTVFSPSEGVYVPLSQVVERFETRAEEALIQRRDRQRTLSVQGSEVPGLTADAAFGEVRPLVEAIALPPGYRLEWGGEYEAAGRAQASLGAQVPIGFLVMLVISILLFGKVRQPLILWLVVPMSVTGMVVGLLTANLPFTFTALLGFLSLSGMLMKNAIVLVDEIDAQRADGKPDAQAIVEASVSRLRPVTLASGTTILGMLPLLGDAFFQSMAVTIMGGLAFASVLTLIAVPTLYAILFNIHATRTAPAAAPVPA